MIKACSLKALYVSWVQEHQEESLWKMTPLFIKRLAWEESNDRAFNCIETSEEIIDVIEERRQ